MKVCKKCGRTLPLEDFYRAAGTRDGHRGECKACNAAAKKQWYEAHREQVIAKVKDWQQMNSDRLNAYRRERRTRPEVKAKDRAGHLRRKFGITPETYDEMLAAQGGVCAICERPPRDGTSLHVDHEHGTGRVRGLLCFRCNNALGDFEDDAVLLLRAADYVVFDPEAHELARRRFAALVAEYNR